MSASHNPPHKSDGFAARVINHSAPKPPAKKNHPMPTVGLLINDRYPAALDAAARLSVALAVRPNVRVLALPPVAAHLAARDAVCLPAKETDIAQTDFVVVFGGDGTILGAARRLAPFGTPLLGIHLGHFGFITEAPPEQLLDAVYTVLEGRAQTETRTMLQGVLRRKGNETEETEKLLAVNDIVVASRGVRMVHIETCIGSETLATYAADGVIVSSPTGSTGYSLSAGGPLVHPTAPVLIVTPISPHTLSARTLIVPDTETIYLTVEGPTRDGVLASMDGQEDVPLGAGDRIAVSRSPYVVNFLTVGGPNFYQKIRDRWHYGERVLPS